MPDGQNSLSFGHMSKLFVLLKFDYEGPLPMGNRLRYERGLSEQSKRLLLFF